MTGIIETTIANLVTAASIVQLSLRFLDLSPVSRMRKPPVSETKIASKGFIEVIASIISLLN